MRRRYITVLGVGLLCVSTLSNAQVKKQFSVDGDSKLEEINFRFDVDNGVCSLKAGDSEEVISVYSNQEHDDFKSNFNKNVRHRICNVDLTLEGEENNGWSQSISDRVFGNRRMSSDKIWRVYLNRNQIYNLNLKYGVGQADIDLSGISVKNLKIHTGSADINIGYFSNVPNTVKMDTFYVKVDMGTVAVRKLDLARSNYVKADVGFGDLLLDISNDQSMKGNVIGSVGAGNLFIILPTNKTPVKINVKDSWLCRVKLPANFTKYGANTYVNGSFSNKADDLLTFTLDVGMGNIVFKQK